MSGDSLTIHAGSTLRAVSCAACGVLFAIPAAFYVDRARDGGSIYCPGGHENSLSPADAESPPSASLEIGRQADRAAVLNAKSEIHRRASIAASSSSRDGRWRICKLCGDRVYFNSIERHYSSRHREELLALPAEEFANP